MDISDSMNLVHHLKTLTHIVDLTENTREANARFFDNDINKVPTQAISMGIGTIMKSKKVLLVANGENKADAIKAMIEGPIDTACLCRKCITKSR